MTTAPRPLVLVAADPPSFPDLVSHLRGWGYRTEGVEDGEQLVRRLDGEQPALLLLDGRFEGRDAADLLRDLLGRHPALTIVLLSAHDSGDAPSASELGAYDSLSTPPDLQRLRVVVHHAVERHHLSRRVERLKEVLRNDLRQLAFVIERLMTLCEGDGAGPRPGPLPAASPSNGDDLSPIDRIEKQAIAEALARAGGSAKEAARLLGLGQATVYRKIKRYGIEVDRLARGRPGAAAAGL